MQIAAWMNRRVVCCRVDDDLNQVARLMWDKDLGCLPVLDAAGRIAGIVTDRDICMAAYTRGRALHETSVRACLQTKVATVTPEDTIEAALDLMTARQIRRLPVVDSAGLVIGTFSIHDAARAACESKETRARRVIAEKVCAALGQIAAPRDLEPAPEKVIELEPAAPSRKSAAAPTKAARSTSKRR